jgi:hypothetical protein
MKALTPCAGISYYQAHHSKFCVKCDIQIFTLVSKIDYSLEFELLGK